MRDAKHGADRGVTSAGYEICGAAERRNERRWSSAGGRKVQCLGQGAVRSLSGFGEEENGARLLSGRGAGQVVPALLESGVGEEERCGKG